MKKVLYLLLLSLGLTLFSCKKAPLVYEPTTLKPTRDLQVNESFNWQTSKVIQAEIGISFPTASGLLSKINVYKADPATGSTPIASGSSGYGFNYSTSLIIPTFTQGLWIGVIYPDGLAEFTYQPITGNRLTYFFTPNRKSAGLKETLSGPDCTTGCDQTISGNGTVTIKNGLTYCVTTSFSGSLNFEHWNGGGTVRVCGTANIQNINNMGNNCHIIVADGGTFTTNNMTMDGTASFTAWQSANVTISNINMNQVTTHLTNYSGNFVINSGFSPNGKVDNSGTLSIGGSYNGNSSSGYLNNSGTMIINGSLSMNHNLTNSGSIIINGSFNLNTNHTFINTCTITATGSAALNAGTFTMNGGYLKVNNSFQVNSSGQLILQNQSMLKAVNISLNNNISGAGSLNSIITTGQVTINGNRTVSGAIEWADNDGMLNNGTIGSFINGATFVTIGNATNYVPSGACNPEGFGTPSVTDTDGDGIADEEDDYPADATRAFNNYYPSATSFASMAFEDLWPSCGDFDMNDLVVDVRFNRVTNAQNNVVDLINEYQVRAVGGSLHNGFAFQLDNVSGGSIQSVTGSVLSAGSYLSLAANGVESGTEKPVIVLWDDADRVIHRVGGSFFNTENNGMVGISDLITIQVHFGTAQSVDNVGLVPYNHFLIRNKVRGDEIHLPGFFPTSKADVSRFGTFDDNTDPATGKYYKSKTNLPWGIFIAESFAYPVEKADISATHLKFAQWAQSAGAQYPDWYTNQQGYRDPLKIYGY
jgi:LruC domain-containing protein